MLPYTLDKNIKISFFSTTINTQHLAPSGRNFRVGADGDAREVNVPDGEVSGLDAGDGLGVVVLVQEGAHQDKLEPSRCPLH